ncbi:hypothetical protein DFH06DRAFT_1333705 [Mycena polygramma]|nr:hypothetical protein DFH06DRAFT_1333705 [Mycena polygramma]
MLNYLVTRDRLELTQDQSNRSKLAHLWAAGKSKSRPKSAARVISVHRDIEYSGELVRLELGSLGLILMLLLQLPLPSPLLANPVAGTVQEEVAHEGENGLDAA